MRLGLVGGTFDPIHRGHVEIAEIARDTFGLSEVMLVPARTPPHRSAPHASAYHRFAMVALAIDGHERLTASSMELEASGPSYTATTLRRLHERGLEPWQIFFVIGTDAFAEIATWYAYPRVLNASHFVVVSRPGFDAATLASRVDRWEERAIAAGVAGAPLAAAAREALDRPIPRVFLLDADPPDVSSTDVRRRIVQDEPFDGLVPDAVARHIRQHRLYLTPVVKAGSLHVEK